MSVAIKRRSPQRNPHTAKEAGLFLETLETPRLNRVGGGGGTNKPLSSNHRASTVSGGPPPAPHSAHQAAGRPSGSGRRYQPEPTETEKRARPITRRRHHDGERAGTTRHQRRRGDRSSSGSRSYSDSRLQLSLSPDTPRHNRHNNRRHHRQSSRHVTPVVKVKRSHPSHEVPPSAPMALELPPPPPGVDAATFYAMMTSRQVPPPVPPPLSSGNHPPTWGWGDAPPLYPPYPFWPYHPSLISGAQKPPPHHHELEAGSDILTAAPGGRSVSQPQSQASALERLAAVEPKGIPVSRHPADAPPYYPPPNIPTGGAPHPDPRGPWPHAHVPYPPFMYPYLFAHPSSAMSAPPPPPPAPNAGAFTLVSEAARWSSSSPSHSSSLTTSRASESESAWSSSTSSPSEHSKRRRNHHRGEQRNRRRDDRRGQRDQGRHVENGRRSPNKARFGTPVSTQTDFIDLTVSRNVLPNNSKGNSRRSSLANSRSTSCSRKQEHHLRKVAEKAASDAFGPQYTSGYFNRDGAHVPLSDYNLRRHRGSSEWDLRAQNSGATYDASDASSAPHPTEVRRRRASYYNINNTIGGQQQMVQPRMMQDTVSSSMRFGKSSYALLRHERERGHDCSDDAPRHPPTPRSAAKKATAATTPPQQRPWSARVVGERGAITRAELKGTTPQLSSALRQSFSASSPPVGSSARRPKKRPPWVGIMSGSGVSATSRSGDDRTPISPRRDIPVPSSPPQRHSDTQGRGVDTDALIKRIRASEERADVEANDMDALYRKLRQNYEQYRDDPDRFLASFEASWGGGGSGSYLATSGSSLSSPNYGSQRNFPARTEAQRPSKLRLEMSDLENQWAALKSMSAEEGHTGSRRPNRGRKAVDHGYSRGLEEPDEMDEHPSSPQRSPRGGAQRIRGEHSAVAHTPRTATRLHNLSTQEGVLALIRERRKQRHEEGELLHSVDPTQTSPRRGHVAFGNPYRSLSPLATNPAPYD